MSVMLTERTIRSLRPTAVRIEIADKSQPGLRLIRATVRRAIVGGEVSLR